MADIRDGNVDYRSCQNRIRPVKTNDVIKSTKREENSGFKAAGENLTYYPEWFPINRHFIIYQRHPSHCFWSCMKSTCERNCEMACIWTHLLALIVTVQAFIRFSALPPESFLHPRLEKPLFSLAFLCGCLCFGFSTIFHIFYHHSLSVFENTLKLDLLGIVLAAKGPWIPWIYYSFYCETSFKYVYGTIVCINAIAACWMVTRPNLLREPQAPKRAKIFVGAFSMILPAYALIIYRDGIMGPFMNGQCWVFFVYFFGGIGVYIFCTKIPESLYSGRYDCVIGSHAIFHIFSAFSYWSGIYACLEIQRNRVELGDNCPSSSTFI